MRRLAAALALLAALPVPARAATPQTPLRAYVLERVSDDATDPGVMGGAGAGNHQYTYAAVASATAGPDGRFTAADGALFFGASAESDPGVNSPAGTVRCSAVPAGGQVCSNGMAGAGIAFAVWWEGATFNRVLVAMRGEGQRVELMEGVSGWRLSRWTGPVRDVNGDAAGATASPYGAGSFLDVEAPGGPGGSVAIGHPPCYSPGWGAAGTGAVRLLGGTEEVVATCPAQFGPPAAAAPGSTEWTLTGAAAGVSDVPTRLVVIEAPRT